VAAGGVVTFDCGSAPATITVTSEVPVSKDTTIDGGGLVTLSGGKSSRILHIKSAWNVSTPLLTVQNLTFADGYTTDVANTTSTTKGGAAIFEDGGSLTVIDCTFTNNQCATSGQDVSGGAINGQGVGTLIVEGSTFNGNVGSNGGAIGTQDENVTVVNSKFVGNKATGTGGNPGNGGDGGAMSYDGAMVSWTMCGDTFSNNSANASGGAIFRVAYNDEAVNIDRCTFDGNSVDPSTGNAGGLYLEYATITMTGTTISHNSAHFGGGIWIGHDAVAKITNDTIADNTATMGGGVWFAGGVTLDPEFPGGAHLRTSVRGGTCIFRNPAGRGCAIHAYCLTHKLDYHHFKPMVSVLFPVTFEQGVLTASGEAADGSLICTGQGPSLYDGARNEIAYYFGSGLVTELDGLKARHG